MTHLIIITYAFLEPCGFLLCTKRINSNSTLQIFKHTHITETNSCVSKLYSKESNNNGMEILHNNDKINLMLELSLSGYTNMNFVPFPTPALGPLPVQFYSASCDPELPTISIPINLYGTINHTRDPLNLFWYHPI